MSLKQIWALAYKLQQTSSADIPCFQNHVDLQVHPDHSEKHPASIFRVERMACG